MSYKDCYVCYFPLPRELWGKCCDECESNVEPVEEEAAKKAATEQFIQADHRRRTLGRMDAP